MVMVLDEAAATELIEGALGDKKILKYRDSKKSLIKEEEVLISRIIEYLLNFFFSSFL